MNSRLLLVVCLVVLLVPGGAGLDRIGAAAFAQVEVIDVTKIPINPNRQDVKAIGMGRTQIANGQTFNAMMYNPALLARDGDRLDVLNIQASLPSSTFNAISFLSDGNTIREFKTGTFIKKIRNGARTLVNNIYNGGPEAERTQAIQDLRAGFDFANELQDKVLGPSDNPKIHGIEAIPTIQAKIGNWGFSLYGVLQSGFQSLPSQALSELYALKIPPDLENQPPLQIALQMLTLLPYLDPLFNANTGELNLHEAIPLTIAVAYLDIVGAVGYGYRLSPELSLGANLKVVNRRFSTRIIDPDNYSNLLKEARSDFQSSTTGVTLDLGGWYRLVKTKTDIGLSLQNIIPLPKVNTVTRITTVRYTDVGGTTTAVRVPVDFPFEVAAPFLVNLGVTQQVLPNWVASLDWADVASQDRAFETYGDRFRLGTEYRLDAIRDRLGIAFRAGLADRHFAGGIGFNIFRYVQIDGAYAYDAFIGDNAYYAQLRFGW